MAEKPTGGTGDDRTELVDAFGPTQVGTLAPVEVSDAAPAADTPTIIFSPRATAPETARPRRPSPGVQSPAPAEVGAVGARYVVVGSVGKGGMGTVHLARDVSLLRRVALKELTEEAAREPTAAARFLREVQVTAQLDHPNIVPVYSLEVAPGGHPAYAMKLVEGITFETLIQQTRAFHQKGQPPDEAHSLPVRLEHFLKACDAVAYAHDRGVLHRDLKPPNLMLGAHNEVYVMDWGICRVLGQDAPLPPAPAPAADARAQDTAPLQPVSADTSAETQLGSVVGTPMYMSAEQARGDRGVDARSDQCALGLILFKLISLRLPFPGQTGFEVLYQAAHGLRRPIEHEYGEPIAPELRSIVDRATAADPHRRYPSVRAFADDLRRFLRGEAVEARPDSTWQQVLRGAARHREAVGMTVLALLAAAALAIVGLMWRHERALDEQRFREARIAAATAELAREGDLLQTRVLEVMGELDAFAAVAASAIAHAEAQQARLPGLDPGVTPTPDEGLFTADPAADAGTVRRLAGRLRVAEPQGRELLSRALELLQEDKTEPDDSTPLDLRIGLEAGLAYRWPAPPVAPPAVDPRTRPWYRAAATTDRPHWGEAYVDRGAVRVPFGAPIRGAQKELLGVVTLVFAPARLLERVLEGDGLIGARTTLLLDPAGRVLAARPANTAGTEALARFGEPRLLAALAATGQGHLETTAFGTREMLVFDRVDPFGWTLVAAVPESTLYGPARPGTIERTAVKSTAASPKP